MEDERMLSVSDQDYELLEEIMDANGWSVAEATHRAVHALWTLDQRLQGLQQRHEGEVAEIIGRMRRHAPPELLVRPKTMRKVEEELRYGQRNVRIGIDEFLFDIVEGRLWAERRVRVGGSEKLEIYHVWKGRLRLSNSGLLSAPPDPVGAELI